MVKADNHWSPNYNNMVVESNENNNVVSYPITIGNHSPIANAVSDQVRECPATEAVDVILGGSGSTDPDGNTLTYLWTWTDGTTTYNATGVSPTVTLPIWGTYNIALQVTDSYGVTSSDRVNVMVGDTIEPKTTASVIGALDVTTGVYTSAVTITLTSKDSCSGVKEIHYTIDGVETVINVDPVTLEASTAFTVSENGTHVVTFWAVDNAGRESRHGSTIIDAVIATPPPSSSGGGIGGVYSPSCVYVSLVSTDTAGQLVYSIDGTNWQPYNGSFQICREAATSLTYGYAPPVDNVEPEQTLTIIINIDKTPPLITARVSPSPDANGWNSTAVTVSFECSDSGSGVASCPSPITVTSDGVQTVLGTAYDNAGNSATASITVRIDLYPPAITYAISPSANGYGWHNQDAVVTFTCSDSDSGIASCTGPVTVVNEGAGQSVTGTAIDNAGHSATTTALVNMDKTPPSISASFGSSPNSNGWYNTDVTVSFACADRLSGVASCSLATTVSQEGKDLSVSGAAVDKAGNTATASMTFSLDKTPPLITISGVTDGATYLKCNAPVPSYSVTDSLSGVSTRDATLTGGNANGVGAFTYTVTASDYAGNTIVKTVTYRIVYSTSGISLGQPVTLGKPFKLGSTIPVMFNLIDGCGNAVSTASATLTLQKYSGDTPAGDPIDATSSVPDSGDNFRFTEDHYIYNLSTNNFDIGKYLTVVTLDDGSTGSIDIQMK